MWIAIAVVLVLVLIFCSWKLCALGLVSLVGAGFWAAHSLNEAINEAAPLGGKFVAKNMVPDLLLEAALPWQKPRGLGGSLTSGTRWATKAAFDGSPKFRQALFYCRLLGPFCYPAYMYHQSQAPQ